MKRFTLGIYTLAVLGQGACAPARTDPRSLFLAPWRPPPGQKCFVSKKRLPPVDVFDMTALGRAVVSFGSGSVVAALAFWPADTAWHEEFGPRPDSLVIVETTLPDSLRSPVRAALLAALRERIATRLLVRIDLNREPRLRFAPALECPPVVRSQVEVRRYTAAMQSAGAPPGRAVLQFLVRPDGSLAALKVQVPSGNAEFDRVAMSTVQLLHFTPELINQIPVPGLVRFPVEVRVTRQGPPRPLSAAECPQGRVVEVTNALRAAVLVYTFSPAGAQLLGTAASGRTVRLTLPPASAGYVFVQGADAASPDISDADLKKVNWSVKCVVP
ncbi:MAG TPA: TonB family protein [Gemmatimonadales bacterium]|nr:TonB family protein [Gemmatimonadales bacterium]